MFHQYLVDTESANFSAGQKIAITETFLIHRCESQKTKNQFIIKLHIEK